MSAHITRGKAPRLLIEEWLPAAAIGVECMRERSTGQQPPDKRLHVWWARRPLTVSRAAVLGSLLPADFSREVFERLLGFWGTSQQIVAAQELLNTTAGSSSRIANPHGSRAFKNTLREDDQAIAGETVRKTWGDGATLIDPMAGGGSIPLEAARLGFHALANEYNPVACTILEATVGYPFRFGEQLAQKTRKWAAKLRERFNSRVERFFPKVGHNPPHCYVFARTVPCPDTQHHTPLVPDWHLIKRDGEHGNIVARPIVDKARGTWRVEIAELGKGAGQLREPPARTYSDGKGISIFTERQIPAEYIKAKAQAGEMRSALYAVAVKTRNEGLVFRVSDRAEILALAEAEQELEKLRPAWDKGNVIPMEEYPPVSSDERPRLYGMPKWADMFSPRQILCFGVLVEELRVLSAELYDVV